MLKSQTQSNTFHINDITHLVLQRYVMSSYNFNFIDFEIKKHDFEVRQIECLDINSVGGRGCCPLSQALNLLVPRYVSMCKNTGHPCLALVPLKKLRVVLRSFKFSHRITEGIVK